MKRVRSMIVLGCVAASVARAQVVDGGVVKVPTENSSDAYTLVATPRTPAPNEEREPNDDLYSAQEMPIGAPIIGYHGRKGDADYYRFPRAGTKDEAFEVK